MQTNYIVVDVDLTVATPARRLVDGTLGVGVSSVTVISLPAAYNDGDIALRFGPSNPDIPVPGAGEFEFDCGHSEGVYFNVPAVAAGVARLIIWVANSASFRRA